MFGLPEVINNYNLDIGITFFSDLFNDEIQQEFYVRYGDDDDFLFWLEKPDFLDAIRYSKQLLSQKGYI